MPSFTLSEPFRLRERGKKVKSNCSDAEYPMVSVVLPLMNHHGEAFASLTAWTGQTGYPADRYEIILIGSGEDPSFEHEICKFLRSTDRLIQDNRNFFYALYNCGARAAKGSILIFTEGHSIPAESALRELVSFIEDTGYDGACFASVPLNSDTVMKRAKERLFSRNDRRLLSDPTHWRKIASRGFALRKSAFDLLGGFDDRYRLFTERVVSRRIYETGISIGYAEKAIVKHLDAGDLRLTGAMSEMYTDGECLYRLDHTNAYCEEYFSVPQEWLDRRSYNRNVAWLLAATIMAWLLNQDRCRPGGCRFFEMASMAVRALSYYMTAIFGLSFQIFVRALDLAWSSAKLKVWGLLDEERFTFMFEEFWYLKLSGYYRLKFMEANKVVENVALPEQWSNSIDIERVDEFGAIGFYPLEKVDDAAFRWTGPLWALPLSLHESERKNSAQLEVTVDLMPVRPGLDGGFDFSLAVFLGSTTKRKIKQLTPSIRSSSIAVTLQNGDFARAADDNYLLFLCSPLPREGLEKRELGMAIRGISIEYDSDRYDATLASPSDKLLAAQAERSSR